MCRQCRSGRQKHGIYTREIPSSLHDQHHLGWESFMATCVWKPNAVWKRTARDLQPASYHNSGWRHGTDYYGLDRAFWIVPVAVELHLLHLRLVASELRGRILVLPEGAWNATTVSSRAENMPALLLDRSVRVV